jgi:3-oxoacyl-(acyl-carrier-protein) synthase
MGLMMSQRHVVVRAVGAVSAVKNCAETYGMHAQPPSVMEVCLPKGVTQLRVYRIHDSYELALQALTTQGAWDRAVLLGVMSAREAFSRAGWGRIDAQSIGVIMGSSRGSVHTYEGALLKYLQGKALPVHTSPVTTMGSFATAVADSLGLYGETVDCSMTCSSGLTAIRNAVVGILGGFYERVLCGGAESALTPFTAAQIQPLGIFADNGEDGPACQPCNAEGSHNRMALGEGAAVVALEAATVLKPDGVYLLGSGVGREAAPSYTGVSANGEAILQAMKKAIADAAARYGIGKNDISFVLPHAPGTRKGDASEVCALRELFGEAMPPLFSTKWLTGHAFGAAGVLSVELALHLIAGGRMLAPPYRSYLSSTGRITSARPQIGLIIGAGFGGTATVLVVGRVPT